MLYGYLNYLNHDKNANFLSNYLAHGGKCEFVESSKEGAGEIERMLKQEGVKYVVSELSSLNGRKIFIYADKDANTVDKVINKYRCNYCKGGIVPKSVINEMSSGYMRKLYDLSKYEAVLFSETSKLAGINIALENPSNEKYNLVFNKTDASKINNIKMTISIQEAHKKAFEWIKKQIDYEEKVLLNLSEKIHNQENNIPIYIADLNGNTMITTADKVTYREHGGAEVVIDYSDTNRNEQIEQYLCIMNNPRELDEKVFKQYELSPLTKKVDILIAADKENGRPEFSQSEFLDMQTMIESRMLYEQKLAQDKSEQEIYQYSFLNNEMRRATFEAFEKTNEEHIHNQKEIREVKELVLYDEARSIYRGFRDKDEKIPFDLEKRAENILNQNLDDINRMSEEFQHDDFTFELSNDANGNMIPDDKEVGV